MIIEDLAEYINTIGGYAVLDLEVFLGDDDNRILIREEPGEPNELRYMDGSRAGVMNFALHARSDDPSKAKQQVIDYIGLLDLEKVIISGKTTVDITPTSSPVLINRDETGIVVFAASFRLEYQTEA